MAQTNYTPISLYYSTTASAVPTAANLVPGELAINTNDGKLYYEDSSGVVQVLATKSTGSIGGSTTQVQYNLSGSLAGSANLTFNGTTLTMANDASISGLTVGKGGGALSANTALGVSALTATTTGGNWNTAVGYQASYTNTTGTNNVAIGRLSMFLNSSGAANTSVGSQALYSNTASDNVAIGAEAMYANTSGANNTAVGRYALQANTTGGSTTAIGYQAGYNNNSTANVYVGVKAGYSNTSGGANTFVGGSSSSFCGYANTTGSQNSAFGCDALANNTTASNNTAVGYQAGYGITTGASNTYIGYAATQSGVAVTGEIVLGASITGKGSNTAFIGGTSGAYNGANSATWSIISDVKLKKNIVSLESVLSVISSLRPVEFDYIKDNKHDIGFIAQEYQKILPAQISEGADGMLYLNQNLVPYLVKAIQELTAKVAQLESKLGE